MAIITQRLLPTQIDFVVPNGKRWAITNIIVCNNNSLNTASFDMHFIPSGDPLNNAVTRAINGLNLPPTETFTFDSERVVLDEGDSISFAAASQDLNVIISYLEV